MKHVKRQCMRFMGRQVFEDSGGIYCGRPSLMGNPYEIGRDGNREEVIDKYRRRLWRLVKSEDDQVLQFFRSLKDGDILGCWCRTKPLEACHVDVIISCFDWGQREGLF